MSQLFKKLRKYSRNYLLARSLRNYQPILLYHHVDNISRSPNLHNVEPDVFIRQIEELDTRYKIVFCDEIINRVNLGKSVNGLAAITFDDAAMSAVDFAIPWLCKNGIPSTVFVSKSITQDRTFWRSKINYLCDRKLQKNYLNFAGTVASKVSVDNFYKDSKNPTKAGSLVLAKNLQNYFESSGITTLEDDESTFASVADIQLLDNSLVQIGNHSLNHYVMATLSNGLQGDEISLNQQFIVNAFSGHTLSKIFSVPFGGKDTYNTETLSQLRRLGFKGFLFSADKRITVRNRAFSTNDILGLPRLMPRNEFSLNV